MLDILRKAFLLCKEGKIDDIIYSDNDIKIYVFHAKYISSLITITHKKATIEVRNDTPESVMLKRLKKFKKPTMAELITRIKSCRVGSEFLVDHKKNTPLGDVAYVIKREDEQLYYLQRMYFDRDAATYKYKFIYQFTVDTLKEFGQPLNRKLISDLLKKDIVK